ncbi:FAD-dependent oxidoreductase [Nocardia brasiliensis]|uniref:FAD-dependent oxidoreductase n=1 Tax=Nocardia brasiliensis TaxID=37326 RepID=A0A6G9XPX7_NOCBR|nr:FAD-dependent monooxygenase [Nocardia brasiliensis]QIS03001.1 FAD-dependent oxidoreductase [Nocardia brasiliensis]
MPENSYDVVISGAGPNGLLLAGELALAGVRPLLLDQMPGPSAEPKANGLVGQVVRLLDMRGLYDEAGTAPPPLPGYMFSGLPYSCEDMPDKVMYAKLMSQPKVARQLEKWVLGLGVDLRWGHRLTELSPYDGGVALTVTGPDGVYELDTTFLVGADGGKSFVRKRLGIEFPGSTNTDDVTRLAHVWVPDELRTADGGLDIPGFGRIDFGHNYFERGGVIYAELEPGRTMLATKETGGEPAPEGTAMSVAELRASLRRILGVDVPIEEPRSPAPNALRRIDNQNTRQAEQYRRGNVFLVGDAAHVHSAMGGPGLNLGMQDAANLGWKLAAHLNGWAPTGLLDTYHAERHPVGLRVMMSSLAQSALFAPGPEVTALRTLFGELLEMPDNAAYIARLMAGADARYDTGVDHPLAGYLVPDFPIETATGTTRVTELLRKARPVLLTLGGGAPFAEAAAPWLDRVDLVTADNPDAPATALLIRPDGYVAWATNTATDLDADHLRTALTRWFGEPRP